MKILTLILFVYLEVFITSTEDITKDQFYSLVRRVTCYELKRLKKAPVIYESFKAVTGDMDDNEKIMFLAQMLYESQGFKFSEDPKCIIPIICRAKYALLGIGRPDKSYHGRGYIMLSWANYYQEASKEIVNDPNHLINSPELVAQHLFIAMSVSAWFWREKVSPFLKKSGDNRYRFGVSTAIISNMRGNNECFKGMPTAQAMKRYRYFVRIMQILGYAFNTVQNGCYD